MQPLSTIDAGFLYAENARAPMHVAALQIYDSCAAPAAITRDTIVRQIEARAHLIDCFHNKLLTTPWLLDHPCWVEDLDFDASAHVTEMTLPAPGDWPTLQGVVADLAAEPLPRDRPLWQMCLIHGLGAVPGFPDDAFGIFTKIHHAAVDGVAGIGVTAALHDLQPETNVVQMPARADTNPETNQTGLALAGIYKEMMRPLRTYAALPALSRFARSLAAAPARAPAPRTRLNQRISAERVFDAMTVPLDVVQDCRRLVAGATVNDVMLTLVGGALRRHLESQGELPQRNLTALVPISTHTNPQLVNTGNLVSQMNASLGTAIADPAARLAHVHRSTREAKTAARQMDAEAIATVTDLAPAFAVAFAARNLSRAPLPFNTVVTNVKGPPLPMYLCGARMVRAFGMGPLADRLGVFHTILSYCGEITISVLACARALPDIDAYLECLREELDALRRAAARLPDAQQQAG